MVNKATTHFGFVDVPIEEKVGKVREVFDSVAPSYDIMNDLMSMGVHRLWKRFTVEIANVKLGHVVLDLAGGTGDLSALFSKRVGDKGKVVLADINEAMLRVGRNRMIDKGLTKNITYNLANAECLPYASNQFDRVCIGFGLRNVTDKNEALRSMFDVLKPGGRLLVLEFSKPVNPILDKIYDIYSFKLLPKIGELIANDGDSYKYLAESIRMHPDQATLKGMMEDAGFERCQVNNLTGGIVAVHTGYKL